MPLENETKSPTPDFTGIHETFYVTGQKRERIEFENGIRNGEYIRYLCTSSMIKCEYKNGKLQGKHQYIIEGHVLEEFDYINGIRRKYRCFNDDGIVLREWEYNEEGIYITN